ncbi:MAG: GntR family transcriptional regulator [Paracoccaceae bacterium]
MAPNENDIASIIAQKSWLQQSGGPRYLQLRKNLAHAINSGALEPNFPLPSEREMAEIADVSRVTIRKAIKVLVDDNLVVQHRGSGTFVAPPIQKLEHSLSRLTSFTEDMERRGKTSESTIILADVFNPSPDEIFALGLMSGQMIARIERLRCADGQPMAIERSSISSDVLPHPENVSQSLYDILDEQNLRPVRAIQKISATILNNEQAELLNANVGGPALKITRTGYLESGRAIELTVGIYRGDAYDFIAELTT